MQNRAFLKVSPVENMNFFQREMFVGGGYLSSYADSGKALSTLNWAWAGRMASAKKIAARRRWSVTGLRAGDDEGFIAG
jgi:hypothetical protein